MKAAAEDGQPASSFRRPADESLTFSFSGAVQFSLSKCREAPVPLPCQDAHRGTLSTTRAPEGSTRATACPSAQRSWSKRAAANAPLAHLSLTYLTHTLRLVHARRQYRCTAVPHAQPHHPYLFNIQDGRRNARCAALSTWGARTQPAVAAAWLELLI